MSVVSMGNTFTGELLLLTALSLAIVTCAAREAYRFFRWSRDVSRLDKGEWSRVIRMIREQ